MDCPQKVREILEISSFTKWIKKQLPKVINTSLACAHLVANLRTWYWACFIFFPQVTKLHLLDSRFRVLASSHLKNIHDICWESKPDTFTKSRPAVIFNSALPPTIHEGSSCSKLTRSQKLVQPCKVVRYLTQQQTYHSECNRESSSCSTWTRLQISPATALSSDIWHWNKPITQSAISALCSLKKSNTTSKPDNTRKVK